MSNIFTSLRWQLAQKAEINWWKRYLKSKPVVDYLRWKKSYWISFLESIRSDSFIAKNKDILEVGCGPAGLFTVLDNYTITAIDPLLSKYESELDHFSASKYPNTQFIETGIENFQSNPFDVIFCVNVINHVRDLDLSLNRITNLLKPDGTLILSIDVHNHQFLKRLFRLFQMDILHPHQHDLNDYKTALQKDYNIELVKNLKKRWIFDYYVLRCSRLTSST